MINGQNVVEVNICVFVVYFSYYDLYNYDREIPVTYFES